MEAVRLIELEGAIDKIMAALAQNEAAKQNLLTSLKTLERLSKGWTDALASPDRASAQRSV